MAKVKHQFIAILLTLFAGQVMAQYEVNYSFADSSAGVPKLEKIFKERGEAETYLQKLPAILRSSGYLGASVDSVIYDSTFAYVSLFLGSRYKWVTIYTDPADDQLLEAVRWPQRNAKMEFSKFSLYQQEMLNYLENRGYPFALVSLDSIAITSDELSGKLKIEKGPLYKIDSIRIYGDIRIKNEFLQQYLDIPNGSIYNKSRLLRVDKRISDLAFIQAEHPSDLSMLASGSVLNLYLKQKKNNQVNLLIGLLPPPAGSTSKKIQVNGEANILLRNSLGSGEVIGLNWQQLQQRSPRLNILFSQPYVLRSKFGLDFNFDMLRKDTTYLNLNFRLGTNYRTGNQYATLFFERRSTIVNGINAQQVIATRRLPAEADVSSNNLGLGYEYIGTDYRFNPRKGNEILAGFITGKKNIRKNNQVIELKDPSNPSFKFEKLYDTVALSALQVRATFSAAHYFPVKRLSTFKTALNGGIYESKNAYRNELFQLGGYKLLRGFDEESEYLSSYLIATAEYRYLLSLNSTFFVFMDGGAGKYNATHTYISVGTGISFETRAGLINLAIANGKKDDAKFNLRQTKLHLGFTSYF
jgi:outer membrane protein assembly factor BamA